VSGTATRAGAALSARSLSGFADLLVRITGELLVQFVSP
jgi:hypothetical protein